MTGLMAGYAASLIAVLIAASTAFTIIRSVGRLGSTGEEASHERRPTKAAA